MKISGPPLAPDPGRLALERAYGGQAASGNPLGLEPGLLLKGRVLAADADGMVTVLTDRGVFKASAATALEVGREFWFQTASGGATQLALAGKTNATFDLLRLLLPELLAESPAASPQTPGPGPAAAPDSALAWVAEGAVDASPAPLRLLRFVSQLGLLGGGEAETAGAHAETVGLVKGLLASDDPVLSKLGRLVEGHVQVNQQPPAPGGANYWLFPVFFAGQSGRGEWMFSREEGKGVGDDGAGPASLSFYLAMSRLGEVHLSLASRPGRMTGVFSLATPEAVGHVRRELPGLCRALSPLVGGQVDISCRCLPEGSFKTLKGELSAKAGCPERFSLVDVRA